MQRKATAVWRGGLKDGQGELRWQTTAWAQTAGVLRREEEPASIHDDHFD